MDVLAATEMRTAFPNPDSRVWFTKFLVAATPLLAAASDGLHARGDDCRRRFRPPFMPFAAPARTKPREPTKERKTGWRNPR